ncbi:MAG: isocitrate/isopropylmalate dehydrogenase family protein, partial [Myxococcales bacterium]|nr:isocitrate/isopropylmalate dehydrogenase family protein [Myxococcales bacterium]
MPGDGIGPEVARAAVAVLDAVAAQDNLSLDFVWFDLGAEKYLVEGVTLPDAVFESLRDDFDAIFLGALGDPRVPDMKHAKDILLGLRFRLDLYVNLRPATLLHPDLTPLKGKTPADLDFVVFRENTEGLYAGVGGRFKRGTPDEIAITEMISTRKGVERIIRAAFEYAIAHDKIRLCMADKSNAVSHAHGLWREVFEELSEEYEQVQARHLYADVLAMELVRAPEDFDVIVTSNLLGDVLSDLAAQLVGGLGLAPSANLHPGKHGLFEPVHGSAPDIA